MQTIMKRSRQRDAILAYLNTRTDHPTADMVYTAIRETIPNISLGTVYRNLSQLAERGIILRICCDGKVDHFDATTIPHPHFFCCRCGCVKDIPMTKSIEWNQLLPPNYEDTILSHSLIYYGFCKACTDKEAEETTL